MTNKNLITIIVVLLVVLGGSFLFYRLLHKTAGNDSYNPSGSLAGVQISPPESSQSPDPASTASSTIATTTPQTTKQGTSMEDCKRNFSATTLQTAKVDTHNRTVEIVVKNFGTIKVELYDQDAPKAVENFLRLSNSGYYDCLTFHRVSKGFVIQAGDPNGNGTGGESAFGAPFADELNPSTPSYKAGYAKGVLAMANSGPNTNGSQFFIMLDTVPLSHNYTIFGKVVSGQDIVDKIGQVDIIPNPMMGPTDGAPKTPVVMQKVTVVSK